jgi:hypothetical protein
MIIRHTLVLLLGVLLTAVAVAIVVGTLATAASSRSMNNCQAVATVPGIRTGSRTGYANGGQQYCLPPDNPANGHLQLRNRAGNTLMDNPFVDDHSIVFSGSPTSCAGAIVHSFSTTNDNGRVSSDTSGEALNGNPC